MNDLSHESDEFSNDLDQSFRAEDLEDSDEQFEEIKQISIEPSLKR